VIHIPLAFAEHGWKDTTWAQAALNLGLVALVEPFFRYLLGTQLIDSGGSILAIGLLHASFNASGQMSAVPGGWQYIPAMIMLTIAVIAYRRRRGRSFTHGFAPALVADPGNSERCGRGGYVASQVESAADAGDHQPIAGRWLCRGVHQMQPCASSDVKPGCETITRTGEPQPRSTSDRIAPVSAPTRSITGEPNQDVTTGALALGRAGIGAVIADQQVHRLLGDAVD